MHDLPQGSYDSPRNENDRKKNTEGIHLTNTTLVQKITKQLAGSIGAHRFDMWFSDARFVVEHDCVAVSAANPFIARWIESNFTQEIRTAASAALGRDAHVQVDVTQHHRNGQTTGTGGRRGTDASTNGLPPAGASAHHPDRPGPPSPRREPPRRRRTALRLRRLDDFVVSDTNRVAYGAARQLAEAKTGSYHSPLFLHGPCGVGKTHLLQGACRHYSDVWSAAPSTVRYVTAEQFTNEYIAAIGERRIEEFRRRMRRLELLAIDDVHFLTNKERTQVEFLHTFDEINMSGARVIIASDSHPRQLRQLNKALVNRLLSGMIVQIELPDLDLRRRLAEKLAHDRRLNVSEPAIDLIARECTGSIRELEGAINKLLALRTSIHQHNSRNNVNGTADSIGCSEPIGLLMVQQLFQDQTHIAGNPVRISTIIDLVCQRLKVTRSELMASGRHKRVVLARSLIAHLAKKLTTHSFPEIAGAIGRRNHSTVHNANRRMCEQLEADASIDLDGERPILLAELVGQLKEQIIRQHRD